jgi:hypothetical protein
MKFLLTILILLIVIAAYTQDAPVYHFNDSLRLQKLKSDTAGC